MSQLHSSSTTPTPASFANHDPARPATPRLSFSQQIQPNLLSPSSSVRSNASLSPAPSESSAASSSVRFSPFPSPSQSTMRQPPAGAAVEDSSSFIHAPNAPISSTASNNTSNNASTSPSHKSHVSASPAQSSAIEFNGTANLSPATKASQFQLQPPKSEFKPSGSFSSVPSLTASDSTASMSSTSSTSTAASSSETPNVYINGLPPHFPEDQLFALAAPFGSVHSVRSFTRHVGDRASGYGFVLFDAMEAAQACIDSLKQYKNLHPSLSKQVHKIPGTPYFHMVPSSELASAESSTISADAGGSESFKQKMLRLADNGSSNLYMEGLPLSMDEPTLAALVAPHAIKSSRLFQTKLSNPPRIIAFVRMETRHAAEDIIERLHGRMVRGWNDAGSRISVRFADTTEQRELRRNERNYPDGGSSGRLTIAQAALLNLHGQDAARPRVRRHPGPVTTTHAQIPVSSSLPVIGSGGRSPLSFSSSLPVIGQSGHLPMAGMQSGLPIIGTQSPLPVVGSHSAGRLDHTHGSTLPVHPQIAAFQSGKLGRQSQTSPLGFDHADVLDLTARFDSGMTGLMPSSASLASMYHDAPLSYNHDGSFDIGVGRTAAFQNQFPTKRVRPLHDQIQALRRSGIPFVPQQGEYEDLDQQPYVNEIVGHSATSARARNGYTPAEEMILQAHSETLRQNQLGGRQFQQQQRPQAYRPTQLVNQFALEEEQFHEHFGQQRSEADPRQPMQRRGQNQVRRMTAAPNSDTSKGPFLQGRQLQRLNNATASIQQTLTSSYQPSLSMQQPPSHSATSHIVSQQPPSSTTNDTSRGSYQPHVRASTLPQQQQHLATGRHFQTNSLSMSILDTSNSSPHLESRIDARSCNGPTHNIAITSMNNENTTNTNSIDRCNTMNRHSGAKGKVASTQSSANMRHGAPLSAGNQSTNSTSKEKTTTTIITTNISLDNSLSNSKLSPSTTLAQVSKQPPTLAATGSAIAYDSPLNSPALTYSSSSASLSPATPYFAHSDGFQSEQRQQQKQTGDVDGLEMHKVAHECQPVIIVEESRRTSTSRDEGR